MAASAALHRKPRARTETVEDLVDRVRRGLVRVPRFQRGLKWRASDVVALFDSIYRGYPIGSLLLWKRQAEAARLELGPMTVDAPETPEAWWVVDGQQRLTALAVSLTRADPVPRTPDDPYVVYFDPREETFHSPPPDGEVPTWWVPLTRLLDGAQLTEWIFGWQHGRDDTLRRTVFEAGKRIREYSVPLYLLEEDDEELLERIFYRVNSTGRPLEWPDVHDALFGRRGPSPSTLAELAQELAELGMGRLADDRLLTCLLASRGEDVTRTLEDHLHRDPDVLRDAVAAGLPILRRVLAFLRDDAEIPHLRLLPQSQHLDVLTRFFALHPDPRARTRLLLTRWLWRAFFGATPHHERTLRRRGVAAIDADDEERSVQQLLALVRAERPSPIELPERFDTTAAASRVALLAVTGLEPRHLVDGSRLDVAALLEAAGSDAFTRIVSTRGSVPEAARGPANRTLHPPLHGPTLREQVVARIREHGPDDPVLVSHGIGADAARRLGEGDVEGFLAARASHLVGTIEDLGRRLAGWGKNDRPSIDYLLGSVEAEA